MRVAVFRTYFFLRLCKGNWNLLVSLVRFGSFFVVLPSVVVTKFPVPTYYSEKKKNFDHLLFLFLFFLFLLNGAFEVEATKRRSKPATKGLS